MKDRLNLNMSLRDAINTLARHENEDGYNPGAVSALTEVTKVAAAVDPQSALGPFGPLLSLDNCRIYGPLVWLLYKDICGQDAVKMIALLRAVQLGYATRDELNKATQYAGRYTYEPGAEMTEARRDELIAKVRKQLRAFDRAPVGEGSGTKTNETAVRAPEA
jgi:hypothetical protein